MSPDPSVFIAIPVHDGRIHYATARGCFETLLGLPHAVQVEARTGSFLPMQRDDLTLQFLESSASHMLCVDSDVGFRFKDVQALFAADKDFVAGCYPKKQPDRALPVRLTDPFNQEGSLIECEFVPGGFSLIKREAVERMVGAYRKWTYRSTSGTFPVALWLPTFELGSQGYDGEDVAFCRRWRALGGKIWLHSTVWLEHYGELKYTVDPNAMAAAAGVQIS